MGFSPNVAGAKTFSRRRLIKIARIPTEHQKSQSEKKIPSRLFRDGAIDFARCISIKTRYSRSRLFIKPLFCPAINIQVLFSLGIVRSGGDM